MSARRRRRAAAASSTSAPAPLPPELREAERGWWDPLCFATVRPDFHRWAVYEVSCAGLRMPQTSAERRRSYDTLEQAMAAAERRNRILRRRDAALDAEWPLPDDRLPWQPPSWSGTPADEYADELIRWHLDRCAARARDGRPVRSA